MSYDSLGARLGWAMHEAGLKPAMLAARCGTTEATIHNWLKGKVKIEHVKAVMLLRIADVLDVLPSWLLLNEGRRRSPTGVADEPSQAVTRERLIIALQLTAEALEGRALTLPPAKRAEVTMLACELLEDGLPEAKIIRFVRAAAA